MLRILTDRSMWMNRFKTQKKQTIPLLLRRKGSNWSTSTSRFTSSYFSSPSSLLHILSTPLLQAIKVSSSSLNPTTTFSSPLRATTLSTPVCPKSKVLSLKRLKFLILWVKNTSNTIETTSITISLLLAMSMISTKLSLMSSCWIPAKASPQPTEAPKLSNLARFQSSAPMDHIWCLLIRLWILSFSPMFHRWLTIIWSDMKCYLRHTVSWLEIWSKPRRVWSVKQWISCLECFSYGCWSWVPFLSFMEDQSSKNSSIKSMK